jgi:hypothetical protein
LLILITAYGEGNAKEVTDKEGKLVSSADSFKILMANLHDCLVLEKCGALMQKLREIVDQLINIEYFRP